MGLIRQFCCRLSWRRLTMELDCLSASSTLLRVWVGWAELQLEQELGKLNPFMLGTGLIRTLSWGFFVIETTVLLISFLRSHFNCLKGGDNLKWRKQRKRKEFNSYKDKIVCVGEWPEFDLLCQAIQNVIFSADLLCQAIQNVIFQLICNNLFIFVFLILFLLNHCYYYFNFLIIFLLFK